MSSRNNKTLLTILVACPVVLIIAGAFTLSATAVIEELRFVNASDQIMDLVDSVHFISAQQSGFAQTPGEDVWNDLAKAGQLVMPDSRINPWRGDMRAVTVPVGAMRIENDLPTHECRRLARYFMEHRPSGLLAIEAQSVETSSWAPIYPVTGTANPDWLVGTACGTAKYARLAVILRVK
jgi:hypothetical protein